MFNRIILLSLVFSLKILLTKTEDEDPLKTLQYRNYLREVLEVLEEDPIFVKLLQNSSYEDLISGRINHLKFLNHGVRTKLDDMKRSEIHRLNTLLARKRKLLRIPDNEVHEHAFLLNQHLDHSNQEFSLKDLENLVTKSRKDLEEVDRKRKEEFQQYEMQKELERRMILQKMNPTDRQLAEEAHKKVVEAHKNHPDINHPGSLNHFKEVWEKEDGLIDEPFDSRTFFKLHDLNDDEVWDEFEIEALFQIELNKIFIDPYDPYEREEEMNRMREHLVLEFDINQDGVVEIEEYLTIQKARLGEAHVNEGWTSVDDEPQFNEHQFEQYSSEHATDLNTPELFTVMSTEITSTISISTETTGSSRSIPATMQTETTVTPPIAHETTTMVTATTETTTPMIITSTETTTTTVVTTTETTTTTVVTTTEATTTTTVATTTILISTTSSSLFLIKGTVDNVVYWINCNQNTRQCSCGVNEKEASVFKSNTVKSGYVQLNLIDNGSYCLNVYSGSQNVNLWLCENGRNAIFTPALQGSWTKSNAWYDGWFTCLGNGQQLTISEKQNEWQFVTYIK